MNRLTRFAGIAILLSFGACGVNSPREMSFPGASTPFSRVSENGLDENSTNRINSTRGLNGLTPLITFVFDDGYDTDYLVAMDIFSDQDAVACSAITTEWINRPGHMSADQIIGLRDAGWEIMSHTATHPNLRSLTSAQVEEELSRSKTKLEGLGVTAKNLVYPYNKSNEAVREIVRKYYRSGRGGKDEFNQGVKDPYDLRSISSRNHGLMEIRSFIDRACAEKNWLIIYHHQIDAKATLTKKQGSFLRGEQLLFSPSNARGRHRRNTWFLTAGSLHFIPLAGMPQPGDSVVGAQSGTSASIGRMVYDQRTTIADLVHYVHAQHPDMRIVTIDQGLDILGVPDIEPPLLSHSTGTAVPVF